MVKGGKQEGKRIAFGRQTDAFQTVNHRERKQKKPCFEVKMPVFQAETDELRQRNRPSQPPQNPISTKKPDISVLTQCHACSTKRFHFVKTAHTATHAHGKPACTAIQTNLRQTDTQSRHARMTRSANQPPPYKPKAPGTKTISLQTH